MSLPTVPGYEVRGLLAGGGMGSVYLAHRRGAAGFVRSVAIKVMHTHLASSSEFGAMFVREALLHGRIEHPNVVRVEDFGEFSEGHYLVLEYVDGWSLAQVLRACAAQGVELPVDLAASIVHAALDGLGAVHDIPAQGGRSVSAVHGDVSPGNILISRAGQVKIIDLGVAATTEEDPFTGQFVRGKAGYVSKEQARAEEIDRRADIYSVGVVFWEMLTCQRLRPRGRGDGPVPPPSTIAQSVPREVDEVVLRAMADAVQERYATARDMRRALAAACPSSMFVDAATIADFVLGQVGDALESERAQFGPTDVTVAAKSVFPSAPPSSPRTPTPSWPALPGLRTASSGPLIGREGELARLSAVFAAGQHVVAVTGAAGVGKTHFAAAAAQRFDRSVVVPVAGVESLAELEHRCRAALRTDSTGTTAVVPLIAEYAQNGSLALVFDGTESVAPEALAAVHDWCVGIPELRVILVTRNTDQGDAAPGLRLAPFAVPDTTDRLRDSAAFALWIHAVQRHDAGYEPEPGSLRDVMAILRLTDGLPLAIRVAAGRMTALSPSEIREELERSVLSLDAEDSSAPLRAAAESALKQMSAAGRDAAAALAHLAPLFSVRSAVFVLRRLEIPGHKRVLEELVSRNVLVRTGTQLSLFSFFRSYLRAAPTPAETSSRVVQLARDFLQHQAREALVDARARVAAEDETPAYLDTMARLLALPDAEPSAWAWLSDVVLWLCSEQQILSADPVVVQASQALLSRGPCPFADALLATGLADPPRQERHALAALATSWTIEPLRSRIAVSFGAAWSLTFLGRGSSEIRETAERLRSLAASPENSSIDRLKASLLRAALLQGLDEPIEAGELVSVLHGLRREGDLHDVANACRILVQCDESELVERHIREAFPVEEPCRTGAAVSRVTTHADALLDLGRVAEAHALYARTMERRDARAMPNGCFRALRGLALCAADQEDYDKARAWAELEHETTTLPSLANHTAGMLAWLQAVTGHPRASNLERARGSGGRDSAAADVWWAMADHRVATSVASLGALRGVVARRSPLAPQSFLLRLALRFAEREMGRALPGAAGDRKTWTIKEHGACIEPPEGESIQLGGKPLLARLTVALAEARLGGTRDGYLTVEEIVLSCWPDERMSDDSAANRVRVCIARLRDVGLRPILEGSRLGYRLRPDLPLVLQ